MVVKIKTAPTIEPITLAEAKAHLRIDSEDIADDITTEQTVAPGSHAVAAAYSLEGSSINVSGYSILVNLNAGDCSGGTVDVKLQDSDDEVDWTDVSNGAFTQVDGDNDNAVQEKGYTGVKTYLRAVATVATAACEFSVDVIKDASTNVEDNLITALIETARQYAETFQRRAYLTQTWEMWLDAFPSIDNIEIPFPPLQSITSITYYDTADADAIFADTNYFVDIKSEPGRVSLGHSKSWPSTVLRPINGVCIEFIAGYGDARTDTPRKLKQAMLLLIGHLYENREAVLTTGMNAITVPMAVDSLLWQDRVF